MAGVNYNSAHGSPVILTPGSCNVLRVTLCQTMAPTEWPKQCLCQRGGRWRGTSSTSSLV